jgi:hypothetical protein
MPNPFGASSHANDGRESDFLSQSQVGRPTASTIRRGLSKVGEVVTRNVGRNKLDVASACSANEIFMPARERPQRLNAPPETWFAAEPVGTADSQ